VPRDVVSIVKVLPNMLLRDFHWSTSSLAVKVVPRHSIISRWHVKAVTIINTIR
jgi:hypothetical protein